MAAERKLPQYPPSHHMGMQVPEGGSNCDKCGHLAGQQKCDEAHFIAWNGGSNIPVRTSRYCCDFFQTRTKREGFYGG